MSANNDNIFSSGSGSSTDTSTGSGLSQGMIAAIIISVTVLTIVIGLGVWLIYRLVENTKTHRGKARSVPGEGLGRSATSVKRGLRRLSLMPDRQDMWSGQVDENANPIGGDARPSTVRSSITTGKISRKANIILGLDGSSVDISRVGSIGVRSLGGFTSTSTGQTSILPSKMEETPITPPSPATPSESRSLTHGSSRPPRTPIWKDQSQATQATFNPSSHQYGQTPSTSGPSPYSSLTYPAPTAASLKPSSSSSSSPPYIQPSTMSAATPPPTTALPQPPISSRPSTGCSTTSSAESAIVAPLGTPLRPAPPPSGQRQGPTPMPMAKSQNQTTMGLQQQRVGGNGKGMQQGFAGTYGNYGATYAMGFGKMDGEGDGDGEMISVPLDATDGVKGSAEYRGMDKV